MAHLIKNNPKIKGVKMGKPEVENVITQFADDTGLYLMYEETTINEAVLTLMHVEKLTGLKVSYEKTCIYRVGSLKNSDAQIFTLKPLMWSDGDIPMLGVIISNNAQQTTKDFDRTIDQLESVFNTSYYRQFTLTGKVLIVNTLMLLLFTYKLAVLPLITLQQI